MNDDTTRTLFRTSGFRVAVISTLTMLALFLLAETVSVVQDFGNPGTPPVNTISVTGTGQATLPPDVARVTFTVENTAKAVADAQAATTKQANAALDFVKGQGVADKDVRTMSYNITPQYTYPSCTATYCPPDRTPKITGYQVSQSVQVTMHDLSKVGDMLAGLGKLQVQNVSGPAFGLEDTTAGYDAARADAIAKAKAQATAIASELGVSLGRIVSFNESSMNAPVAFAAYGIGGAATKAEAAPSVPTGENTYNASVTITYALK